MDQELALETPPEENALKEARLIALVLDGVTSEHSRRSYRTGLTAFFAWIRNFSAAPSFSRASSAAVPRRPDCCRHQRFDPSTCVSHLIRKLAREMSDNGLLDPAVAAAIGRVPGVERRGTRAGNWLLKDQAQRPPQRSRSSNTHRQAVIGPSSPFLLGCGLRRAELAPPKHRRPASRERAGGFSPTWKGRVTASERSRFRLG